MRTMTLSRSGAKRRLAGIAGAGVLALTLAACGSSGGGNSSGGDSSNADGGDQNGSGQVEAATYKQLSEDELKSLIENFTYDGMSFVSMQTESQQGATEAIKNADIKPAECQTQMLRLAGEYDKDNPFAVGHDDSDQSTYSVSALSFADTAGAQDFFNTSREGTQQCKEMTMTVAGQEMKLSMSVEDATVDGADEAIDVITTLEGEDGTDNHNIVARVGNGIVGANDLRKPSADVTTPMTSELVKAYQEAAQG